MTELINNESEPFPLEMNKSVLSTERALRPLLFFAQEEIDHFLLLSNTDEARKS